METRKEVEAILVMVLGFLALYFIFGGVWWLRAALGIGIVSLAIPFLGSWIVKGWFKLAEGLGWINSRILLSIIFFLILTPIALLSRLFKKNSLKLKDNPDTLFNDVNKTYSKEDLEKMW